MCWRDVAEIWIRSLEPYVVRLLFKAVTRCDPKRRRIRRYQPSKESYSPIDKLEVQYIHSAQPYSIYEGFTKAERANLRCATSVPTDETAIYGQPMFHSTLLLSSVQPFRACSPQFIGRMHISSTYKIIIFRTPQISLVVFLGIVYITRPDDISLGVIYTMSIASSIVVVRTRVTGHGSVSLTPNSGDAIFIKSTLVLQRVSLLPC